MQFRSTYSEDAHVCYIASRQTQWQSPYKNTTWLRATSCEWIYAWMPARASKMVDRCTNTAAARILYLREEAVLRKIPRFKSSDCSAEVIRRSSWLIRYCLEKSNRTHTHAHTPNYCNPAAHACQGLMTLFSSKSVYHIYRTTLQC